MADPHRLEGFFRRVVAARLPILAAYAVLVPLAAWLATRIPSEAGIGRLVVPSDPDYVATRAFQKVFPEGQMLILLFEADDPWRPELLAELEGVARALRAIPGVVPYTALDVYRRARPGFRADAAGAEAYRAFATGTDLFRRQGLVGDRFQGMAVSLGVQGPQQRDALLSAVDRALEQARRGVASRVRKVGAPYVVSWIEHESSRASLRVTLVSRLTMRASGHALLNSSKAAPQT